jgi:hypothetical protein
MKRQHASFFEFRITGADMHRVIARHYPIQTRFGTIELSAQPSDFQGERFGNRTRSNQQKPVGRYQ